MSRTRFSTALTAAVLLAATMLHSGPARALPAIESFDTFGFQNNNVSFNRTQGWIFTALDDLRVTHLGLWDKASDGLVAAHKVGIWDAGGTLLGTTVVQAGTASAIYGAPSAGGSFRYEAVDGFSLAGGAQYTIGALFNDDDIFEYFAQSVTTSAGIAFGEERYSDWDGGFVFPTDTFGRTGLFGPNFRYVEIPEPATAGLLALGLAGLAVVSCRRRRNRPAG